MQLRPKTIAEKDKILEKLSEGIGIIASIVKRTLGPGGLPILIERVGQNLEGDPIEPMITKDGVTVASECAHEDEQIDIAIQTVKAICRKTNRLAGDGTTTAIVLGEAIFNTTLDLVKADSSLNPQIVKEAVESSVQNVIKELEELSIPIGNDFEIIKQVATISANGANDIGEVIKEAFQAVGSEGVVTIDEGSSIETTIEIVKGFQFNRGAEGTDRFFNNQEKTKFDAENCLVVTFDGNITHHGQLLGLFKQFDEQHRKIGKKSLPPILIIANEFSQDTLQLMLLNKAEAGLNICLVRSPNVTTVRTAILDDLATVLGSTRLGNGNHDLESAIFKILDDGSIEGDVGMADRVVIDRYSTTIYGGLADEETIIERIDQLKASRKQAFSEYDRSQFNDRIASLSRGIAKIGVGGRTELEIKEKYHRIEDALNSARAAIDEGIIPGGGITLYRLAEKLKDSEDLGDQILSKALKSPFFQIIENIGVKPNDELVEYLVQLKNHEMTYDARNKKVVEALEAGIVDPVKVTRTALENATSISALLSTCGGAITYLRKSHE